VQRLQHAGRIGFDVGPRRDASAPGEQLLTLRAQDEVRRPPRFSIGMRPIIWLSEPRM
jgi:hypothetical protein